MKRESIIVRFGIAIAALACGVVLAVLLRPDGHDLVSVDEVGRDLNEPAPGRAAHDPQVATGRDAQEPGANVATDLAPSASASAEAADAPESLASTEGADAAIDSTDAPLAAPTTTVPSTQSSSEAAEDPGSQVGGAAVPGEAPATTAPPATTAAPSAPNAPTTAAPPATTAAPATTAPPPAPKSDGLTIDSFTDWPIRNTSLDARTQFVDTPASQIDWQQFTEPSDRSIQLGSVTANKHLGQFRTQCSFSHFAYDDPLVAPGQPGGSHLHMFFGNSEANANSTYQSLRDSGSSTCNGLEGNRTGYWVPAVFDASGNARIPSRIEVYYKSHDRAFEHAQKPPEGLGMVAGTAASNPNIEWACQETGAQGQNLNRPIQQRQNTIPRCSNTATLLAHIKFPQCLSGSVNGGTGNASGQMSYPTRGFFTDSCPAGSVYVTAIEYFIAWSPNNHDGQTDQWWLSSDVLPDGTRAANGSTLHGDWFGGWNPALMDQIHANCVARLAECSWDLVADNRRLAQVEHFGGRRTEAYNGRRSIPASEISAALCPGDDFGAATDAANCDSARRTFSTTLQTRTAAGPDRISLGSETPDYYCALHLPPLDS